MLAPIRERRTKLAEKSDKIYDVLRSGCNKAVKIAKNTLEEVRKAIGVEYW